MKSALHETVYAFQSLKPQSSSSASNDGSVADLMGFDEMLVILNAGAATGAASTTISVRVSANSDGSSSNALSGASFTAITSSNHNAIYVGRIDLSHIDTTTIRYAFTRAVGDGANVQLYSTTFILANWKYRPINAVSLSPNGMATQTAAFNVAP
jgi:hypothetical protein